MCILSVHTLLKVVGYYELSVLSMSVMGFQKSLDGGWVGGVSSVNFFWIFGIFLTLQSPLVLVVHTTAAVHGVGCSGYGEGGGE